MAHKPDYCTPLLCRSGRSGAVPSKQLLYAALLLSCVMSVARGATWTMGHLRGLSVYS